MAILFEGFPKRIDPASLKPGRWFATPHSGAACVCLVTDSLDEGSPIALGFAQQRAQFLDIVPLAVKSLDGPIVSIEGDVVFIPGDVSGPSILPMPSRREPRHGSLVQIESGDMAVAVQPTRARATLISLSTGQIIQQSGQVFDRWALVLRRRGTETILGAHAGDGRWRHDADEAAGAGAGNPARGLR